MEPLKRSLQQRQRRSTDADRRWIRERGGPRGLVEPL